MGFLEILDIIGIDIVYNIMKNYLDINSDFNSFYVYFVKMFKEEFIDKGCIGKVVGYGFYDYD